MITASVPKPTASSSQYAPERSTYGPKYGGSTAARAAQREQQRLLRDREHQPRPAAAPGRARAAATTAASSSSPRVSGRSGSDAGLAAVGHAALRQRRIGGHGARRRPSWHGDRTADGLPVERHTARVRSIVPTQRATR